MLQRFISWLDTYREIAFDLIRIYLGIGLFVRGVLFAYDPAAYTALVPADAPAWVSLPGLFVAVACVHVGGGAAIAVGVYTRLAALLQIPVLFGAVFLSLAGLFGPNESFELSTLVLFLLALVFVYGSGRWSVDQLLKRKRHGFQRLLDGLYEYRSVAFDALRIYLGIGLFLRGILFISDAGNFFELVGPDPGVFLRSTVLLHYVALAHIFGGFMMTAGLLTRIAALIQIPILIGATFVSQQGGLLASSQNLELAALTLFLLVLIFLYGSGKWSSDHFLFKRPATPAVMARTERAEEILLHAVPAEGPFIDPVTMLVVPEAHSTQSTVEELYTNPSIVTQARYGFLGWFLFLANVTPRPKEIVFRNVRTGEVVKRSKDPKVLDRFRYM